MARTTIALVRRDRFSEMVRTIRSVLGAPPVGFTLIMVDRGAPAHYRAEIEQAVCGRPGVELLQSDDLLDANATKNWVVSEARDREFLHHRAYRASGAPTSASTARTTGSTDDLDGHRY